MGRYGYSKRSIARGPLQTFAKQEFFGLEGAALVNHLWESLPSTRFKRFQELFCDPSDYAIPKPNLAAPCVEYPSHHNLNNCSLAPCLVSPPRIPMIRNSLFQASCRLRDEMKRSDGFFNQRGLSAAERTSHANIILSRLGIPVDALNQVSAVRPLRAFKVAHRLAYADLRNALLNQNGQQAREAMVKLVIFSKLQRANAIFEVLRALTGRSQAVPLKELRRHASSLRNLLELRSVFPQTTVPAFQPTYRRLQRTVGSIAGGLERYYGRGMDLDERTQMYSRLRAYLDKTDLEARVVELLALNAGLGRAGEGGYNGSINPTNFSVEQTKNPRSTS